MVFSVDHLLAFHIHGDIERLLQPHQVARLTQPSQLPLRNLRHAKSRTSTSAVQLPTNADSLCALQQFDHSQKQRAPKPQSKQENRHPSQPPKNKVAEQAVGFPHHSIRLQLLPQDSDMQQGLQERALQVCSANEQ